MKKIKWLFIDIFVILTILSLSITLVALGQWSWKWGSIFLLITYALNALFVVFTITNDDVETEKLSWIFFMFCVPVIGIVYYFLFRIRRQPGLDQDKWDQEFEKFEINKYSDENKNNNNNHLTKWQSSLVNRNFYDVKIKAFKYGYEAYEELLEDIKNAKKYIHIEMYILKNSEIYQKLKKILIEKAKNGIEVKIIFDKFGSWKVPIDEFHHLKKSGIELCFFNIPYYPYVRYTDNRRLHRKFFIIDGEIVHFGGLNIADEYCSLNKMYGYWADTNFSARGEIINDYESVFMYDWFSLTKEKLEINKYVSKSKKIDFNSKMLVFEEGPNKKTCYLEDSIDYWINNSKKSITIATPYFIPTIKIMSSLKNAIKRGVKIQIFIPGKPDKKLTYNGTLFYTNELTKLGAKIWILNETFLHSKIAVFDDEFAYIGTNNLDMRSFYTNHESINLILGNEIIRDLNDIFDEYRNLSFLQKINNSKIKYKFKKFVFKLLAPLM